MGLARASDEIDRLIEKRGRQHEEANFEEMAWKESTRKHNAKLRRQHRAEWFSFYSRLAASHALISRDFERRAEALLDDTEGES